MQLTAERKVKAPIEFVFQEFTNFVQFESTAITRGLDIERTDGLIDVETGISWHLSGRIRGKQRDVDIELTDYSPAQTASFHCESKAVDAHINLRFLADGPNRTQVQIDIDPSAKNISARLMLQSVKLAHKTIEKRINTRLKDFCKTIEEKHKAA